MSNGIRTTNLPLRYAIDELIANITADGVQETARVPTEALANQLAGTGPFVFGNTVYVLTKAALDAYTPSNERMGGVVLNDPNAANNGYYARSGGAWVRGRGFPDSVVLWTQTGGTSNALQVSASAGVDPASIVLALLIPTQSTSAGATVSINGAAAVPIYSASGAPLAAGELVGGMASLLAKVGTAWRLINSNSKLAFRRAWTSATTYVANDLVERNGSIWLALRPNTNVTPAEGADWTLFLPGVTVADASILDIKISPISKLYNRINDIVSVKDYGAKGDGVTDDSDAIQAAIDALHAAGGGTLHVPKGRYKITRTITGGDSSTTRLIGHIHLSGSSSTDTFFDAQGIAGPAFDFNYGAGALENHLKLSGVRVLGNKAPTSIGIQVIRAAYMYWQDVAIEGFVTGLYASDIEQSTFVRVNSRFNDSGGSITGNSLSTDPNSLTFIDCHFSNNTICGLQIEKANALYIANGSFQYNGTTGADPAKFGLKLIEAGTGYGNVVISGTAFESNGGDADLFIHNDANPCVVNVIGASFVKSQIGGFGPYALTNILASGTAANQIVNVSGNSFRHFGTYTPSALRPYITKGNLNSQINDLGGNFYQSSLETPTTQVNRIANSLRGSVIHDVPILANLAGNFKTIPVTGAAIGDFVLVTFSQALNGITLTGYVSAANTVTACFFNGTGGTLDLPSGLLSAAVVKP